MSANLSVKTAAHALNSRGLARLHSASTMRKPSDGDKSQRPAKEEKIKVKNPSESSEKPVAMAQKPKTQAQLDKELQDRMAGLSGDGGEAGVELEGGQPVAMKRSVKNNMFRYI